MGLPSLPLLNIHRKHRLLPAKVIRPATPDGTFSDILNSATCPSTVPSASCTRVPHLLYSTATLAPMPRPTSLPTSPTNIPSPPPATITEMDNESILEQIDAANPDILLVAFGNPKQEKWIYRNREKLNVAVSIGVGAALDFLGGSVARAPRWMQSSGLEWLHRLGNSPRRLARRPVPGPDDRDGRRRRPRRQRSSRPQRRRSRANCHKQAAAGHHRALHHASRRPDTVGCRPSRHAPRRSAGAIGAVRLRA